MHFLLILVFFLILAASWGLLSVVWGQGAGKCFGIVHNKELTLFSPIGSLPSSLATRLFLTVLDWDVYFAVFDYYFRLFSWRQTIAAYNVC